MERINASVYNYMKIISQQNQLRLKQFNYFLYNQKNQVEDLAYCIYMQAKLNIIAKHNIIVQDTDYFNQILLQEIDIISQGWRSWIRKKYNQGKAAVKRTVQQVKKHATKVVNKAKQGIAVAKQKLQAVGNKITDGVKSAWNKCKEIAGEVWDAIKKLGSYIADWVKAAIGYMKRGFQILFKAKEKNMGFQNPNDIKGYSQQTNNMSKTAFPCFEVPAVQQKMKSPDNLKQIHGVRQTMANGGNVDAAIDAASKSIGNGAMGTLQSSISGNKSVAESAGKDLKAHSEQTAEQPSAQQNDKLAFQNYQNDRQSTNLKNYFNMIYEQKKLQLKELIIEQAFNGITPKMLIEGIDATGKQADIIIGGSNLHFYTNCGQLICEQTVLSSNKKIIYESNTKFLGKHLIWQQSENKYVRSNIILQQQDKTKAKGFLKGGIVAADLILVGCLVLAIFGIFYAIKTAVEFLIAACTGGISLVAKPLTDAGATPPVAIISFKGIFGIISLVSLAAVGSDIQAVVDLAKQTKDQLMRAPIKLMEKVKESNPKAAEELKTSPEDNALVTTA